MEKLLSVDWGEMFIPTHSVAEIVLRGTIMFVALLMIMRFAMVRRSSTIGLADILVIVVIADAAQNGFAKEYKSLTEGLLLVLTIVFWDFLLNFLSYHFKFVERILTPPSLALVENGRMNKKNMRSEFITVEELQSQLRQQGVSDVSEVKRACLEANGEISVVKKEDDEVGGKSRKKVV